MTEVMAEKIRSSAQNAVRKRAREVQARKEADVTSREVAAEENVRAVARERLHEVHGRIVIPHRNSIYRRAQTAEFTLSLVVSSICDVDINVTNFRHHRRKASANTLGNS